ncbi:helix-turn-helix transcriptional regulator [Amycolatopsis sp. OK19-0408]|uniref:Helix-turn-helix transcriptional regulator n=1 Tax=Amycolatopsis iheyensis TaxID=2945988 RepID=A0A9X2NDF2_9PSEU|nr:helix-turn-helix domain-containing protein [Amycolatopsis iheyensis]MCR6484937.1 helix-turn-helix transcriptional regulator [Amycolatopsis iheyensis]
MALPSTYAERNCSLSRALEVVGERWTLLIVRDAFHGVRRFGDFATQLGIPRAVLTARLKTLVREGVLVRDDESAEYRLTERGVALWPVVRALMHWGDEAYSPAGPKRDLRHDADGGLIDAGNRCRACGAVVPVPEIRIEPGPGYEPSTAEKDPVSEQMSRPRLLLEPLAR